MRAKNKLWFVGLATKNKRKYIKLILYSNGDKKRIKNLKQMKRNDLIWGETRKCFHDNMKNLPVTCSWITWSSTYMWWKCQKEELYKNNGLDVYLEKRCFDFSQILRKYFIYSLTISCMYTIHFDHIDSISLSTFPTWCQTPA